MRNEDALQFVQERLHRDHRPAWLRELLHLWPRQRVRRRMAVQLPRGGARRLDGVDCNLMVRCDRGTVWITQDGDPKDVFLKPGQSWQASRRGAADLFALEASVLEIEFEDDPSQ